MKKYDNSNASSMCVPSRVDAAVPCVVRPDPQERRSEGSMEAGAQQRRRGRGRRGDDSGHRTTRARGVSGGNPGSIAGRPISPFPGWGNYFRTGNADREFNKMNYFVVKSLRRWQYRRGGQRPTKRAPFTGDQLYGMGLHKLMGTVKYPAQATPIRSSLSRVRYVASRVMWRPMSNAH